MKEGTESLFKEIIAEIFQNLEKKLDIQVMMLKAHLNTSMQKHILQDTLY